MKNSLRLKSAALSFVATGCLAVPLESSNGLELRVMSFNIRNSHARDGENHWDFRKELVYEVIRDYSPDVLGLQEANRFQMDELNEHFPEYAAIGIGSEGETKGQYSSIHYLKKRFEVSESGTFWLSETPEEPSRDWGSAHVRICTWAQLVDQETGQPLYVYNTHMDDGSQKARENGARLIMKQIHGQTYPAPFILMGDFNAPEDNPVIAYVNGTGDLSGHSPVDAVDTFRVLHPDKTTVGTFNGFEGRASGPKIDYIFVSRDIHTLEATIVRTSRDGRYPSDHFPVTAQLRFEQKAKQESAPPDLITPSVVNGEPAPGKRVRQFNKQHAGTGIYHALYLPTDWKKGEKYPVIVEYPGNKWKNRKGTVDECNLGYGISGGKGVIWICMPFVDGKNGKSAATWWGDVAATVDYCKETVSRICAEYGGDSSKVFLAGFSRGAIACNYIGLHDDEIASLWRGFICHSHYDGVEDWGYAASDRFSAATRLKRLGNRPQFISHEQRVDGTRTYLKKAFPSGNFTFLALPFADHTDTWVLRDLPERKVLRTWFQNALTAKDQQLPPSDPHSRR